MILTRTKFTFLLIFIFVLATSLAFYWEEYYRILIRFFFNLFQDDKIVFLGKNFHLFASPRFVIAFGFFSVLFTIFLRRQSKIVVVGFSVLAVALFFITTVVISYLDSYSKVIECTACRDGIRTLHYNSINYDLYFILSLTVALLPLFLRFLKKKYFGVTQQKLMIKGS